MQGPSNLPILPLPTSEPLPGLREAIRSAMSASVAILEAGFGAARQARQKESQSSVVTETDFESEAAILAKLRPLFPEHAFLAEETGLIPGTGSNPLLGVHPSLRSCLAPGGYPTAPAGAGGSLQGGPGPGDLTSRWTWIIDPLDGSSNFAAGIPWFATMLALVDEGEPVAAAISLPAMGEHYYAEREAGAYLNGQRIFVSPEPELANMLAAYSIDWNPDVEHTRREALALARLVAAVRNVRAANCVVDDCFVASGRLGAAVNESMKLWDIAPAALLVTEAGGIVTDIHGRPFDFHVTEESVRETYTRVAATPAVHAQVLRVVTGN